MQLLNNDIYIGDNVLEVRLSVSVISDKCAFLHVHLNNDSKLIESVGMFFITLQAYPPSSDVLFALGKHIDQFIKNQFFPTLLTIHSDTDVISSGVRECVLALFITENSPH